MALSNRYANRRPSRKTSRVYKTAIRRSRARTPYKVTSTRTTVASRSGNYSRSSRNYRRPSNRYGKKVALKRPSNLWKKPAKNFVKKVEAVLSRDTPGGHLTAIHTTSFHHVSTADIQNQQGVWDTWQNVPVASYPITYFTYAQIMDAASMMYNNKVAVATSSFNHLAHATNFDNDTKIIVERQSVNFTVANNYLVPGTLTVYTCFPKTTNPGTPLEIWNRAKTNYRNLSNGDPDYQTLTSSQLYDKPTRYHNFNSNYSVNSKSYHMKPGQQVRFTRNGPAGIYDYTASSDATAAASYKGNAPGKTQSFMFVWIPDMTQSGARVEAILHQTAIGNPPANTGTLAMEAVYNVVVRAPAESAVADKEEVIMYNNWGQIAPALGTSVIAAKPVAGINLTV